MQGNIKTVLAEQGVRATQGTNQVKQERSLQRLCWVEAQESRCGPSRSPSCSAHCASVEAQEDCVFQPYGAGGS